MTTSIIQPTIKHTASANKHRSDSTSVDKKSVSSSSSKNIDNSCDLAASTSSDCSKKSKTKKSTKTSFKMAAPIIIQPTIKHTASVIFLHGLGDTGHGWSYAFREIKKPNVKYIFPTAPVRAVTLNAGMHMNAWFDIFDLSLNAKQDEEGIKHSSQALLNLVDEEIKNGIPSDRIIIGGFSQGGATALYTTVTSPLKFGGVIALSTWLPLHDKVASLLDKTSTEKFKTPILQCHGDMDPLVPEKWAGVSAEFLKSIGFGETQFKVYRGLMHSSTDEEMDDIKDFIEKIAS